MANPYFNATYYLGNNPDVFAAGINTPEAAWAHYVNYGASEALSGGAARKPAPWFDIGFYLSSNPDLATAGLTAGQLFDHFTTYGIREGRQPSANANVNEETLTVYATENEDLQEAFGIDLEAGITDAQFVQLAQHLYAFGYAENRPGSPLDAGGGGSDLTLTVGWDNLTGTAGDDVFFAPVVQNATGSGQLANTFETGDILNGGGGRDALVADLIASGSVSDYVPSPAISATTTGIEEVYLTALNVQPDAGASNSTPWSTIDAGRMSGVEEWWTVESRANIQIEDIRSRPQDTLFGVSLTDPHVGFNAYFNPLFLDGDLSAESALTLVVQEITDGQDPAATELENITVREINFSLNDTSYTLDTEGIRAANTWAELEEAIAAELAEQGLDNLTITHEGNGVFVINDSEGGVFAVEQGEALILGVASDIDTRNRAEVGRIEEEGQTSTTLVLDGAGSGSQGGWVNIAAMSGNRGVEVMDVVVGRDSHIAGLSSVNEGHFDGEQQLEEVYVSHAEGAGGTLKIGVRTTDSDGVLTTTDDRLDTDTGLQDVRVFDATGFGAALKVAASLTEHSIDKYLAGATEEVQFSYRLGDAGSNLSLDVDDDLAADIDFALEIIGGAGDDRINLSGLETKNSTSIDGGEGNNVVEVNTSTGTNPGTSWASFENVQTLVVAGDAGTTQNLVDGNMASLQEVIIATGVGVSTTVQEMNMIQGLTISGKNQTLGSGNSNKDQSFGSITVTDTSGVPGATAFNITLENTARANGDLTVASLMINGADNAISTLNVESAGARDTENAVLNFIGEDVTTLNFVGTQDLSFNIDTIADDAAVTVNGSQLTGDLTLAIDAANLDEGNDDTLTGTAGDSDELILYGALDVSSNISGFETIQFGSILLGEAVGVFDAGNTSGVSLYEVEAVDTSGEAAAEADYAAAVEARDLNLNAIAALEVLEAAYIAQDEFAALVLAYTNALADYDVGDPATHQPLIDAYEDLIAGFTETVVVGLPIIDPADPANVSAAAINAASADIATAHNAETTALGVVVADAVTAYEDLDPSYTAPGNAADTGDEITAEEALSAGLQEAVDEAAADLYSLELLNVGNGANVLIDAENANANIRINDEATGANSNVINVAVENAEYTSYLTINRFDVINLNLEGSDGVISYQHEIVLGTDDYARTLNVTGGDEDDTLALTADLSLSRIDFSGFEGEVTLDLITTGAADTNTALVLNSYGGEFDITAATDTITSFIFTSDEGVWEIAGFKTAFESGTSTNLGTVLDFKALGLEGLVDLNITTDGTDTTITLNDGPDDFEIVLLGVDDLADLGLANFQF